MNDFILIDCFAFCADCLLYSVYKVVVGVSVQSSSISRMSLLRKSFFVGLCVMVVIAVILENTGEADAAPARGPPSYIRHRRKCPSGQKKGMDGICRKKNYSYSGSVYKRRFRYRT